jgi:hypothetical protein
MLIIEHILIGLALRIWPNVCDIILRLYPILIKKMAVEDSSGAPVV